MTWADAIRVPERRVVRQFAGLCFLALAGIGLYQGLVRGRTEWGLGLGMAGVACGVVGTALPGLFRWVYTGAMILVFPIGFTVAQVVLLVMFLGVFLPIGWVLRWTGKDLLRLRREPAGGSYWREIRPPAGPASYLRQY